MTTTLVSNGTVDIRGQIADKRKTGGWKASPFIIMNEVAERLAFYAIAVNMVSYLVLEMRQSLPEASTHVTDWIGAAFVLTLLGAFLADAYLGRFKTIIVFSCIYAVGMVLLTLSASIDGLRPPPCTAKPCQKASNSQTAFLYTALGLIALGTGGIKPCISSFGADQFDQADGKEVLKKYAFFNWFFFAINTGVLMGITVLVYVQVKRGWVWGFGVPTGAMIMSIAVLACGVKYYRFQKPMGSPFTRFVQVMVASARNHWRGVEVGRETLLFEVQTEESDIKGARKLARTSQYRFWDKAAAIADPESISTTNRWNLCTVTQVEEFKSFLRILPVWASTIALSISFAQTSTFFVSQAFIMDRRLGPSFKVPAASVPIFAAINAVFLVPLYEKLIVPALRQHTGHYRGITSLQRMGVGLFLSIFAMASAALVERRRRDRSPAPFSMSFFWLFPQFFLIGGAEVFTYVGQLEFFYDEATDGTRSISSAIFLSEIGIGSWLSTAIVKIIERATGGTEKGWLRNDLNKSKLDYFYWVLTAINVVNFVVYVAVAWHYKGKRAAGAGVRDESMAELDGPHPELKRGSS
ncbi:protein NRT1/ PTR FAMILY 8.1-like [Rhodamnia argentea]|uniref:Protein NRT1/ PTR FAMILY 8.1-like n=1 Tax=Rhodamnia argentea TaxID=178133 RepID=A0A8B8MUT9_9MYRT|nr:protein NRT1/ PTR FAMILY 8.1-like [Rhodamnia argentea]